MLQCVYSKKHVIHVITIDFGEFVLLLEQGDGLATGFTFYRTALSVGMNGPFDLQKPKGGTK
jgi:hypothetical protein